MKRLRSTCALWHFVRESIITHVWSEPEAPTLAPPLHPRSVVRTLSYGSLIGRPSTPSAPEPSVVADASSAPARRGGVTSRVGNLWASGLGALGASSRSASPVPDPPSPSPQANFEPQPAVPPRRVPPISTNISIRTSTDADAPPPPLPPRRRPTSDGKSKVLDTVEHVESPLLDDVATTRSGTREESGLLTPASESDGFRTPPESGPASPVAEMHDSIHSRALLTELPASRPTSLIVDDPAIGDDEGLATPKPADIPEPTLTETPRVHPSSLPLTSNTESTASSAATPPPPLPRRAAARAVVASPAPSRTASPAPTRPSTEVEAEIPQPGIQVVPDDPFIVQPEAPISGDSDSITEPLTPTPLAIRAEKARSVLSEASQYSAEVNDVGRKDVPSALPAPPPLPPRKSSIAVPNGDAYPAQPNSLGPTGTFTDAISWEEKTWKELVKLREDMFWARMGGIRESEDSTQASA